jgi:sortase A
MGLDVIVVEGTEVADLKKGPGHMKGTALPGQGNTVISGHRVTYSRPFFRIDELSVGDPIILYTPSSKYEYRVVEKRIVVPTDVSVIQPTSDARLTLTACHPLYSAKYRIIIIAKLVPRKISPLQ